MLPIDIGVIVAAAAPFIAKGADAFSKTTGEKLGGKIVELCKTVGNKFKGDPYAEQTLARAKEKPESEGRQATLKNVLAEKMEDDKAFGEKVNKLLEALKESGSSNTAFDQRGQTVNGPQTNIAGGVSGTVLSGTFSGTVNTGKTQ